MEILKGRQHLQLWLSLTYQWLSLLVDSFLPWFWVDDKLFLEDFSF